MLDVQVDEFTLVLQSRTKPKYIEQWESMAFEIIKEFVELTKIEIVLGKLNESTQSLPQGYSKGFVSDDTPYYFAIAYHHDFIQMGICIKFSAYAWAKYRCNYEEIHAKPIQIYQLIETLDNNSLFSSRLSRIDIAIDFINEKVNVSSIYNQLSKKNQLVKTASGRTNHSSLSAITKDNITPTFYIGSKGKNIKVLLRVYDKKREQMDTMGFQYEDALRYDNWTRFEAVFRGHYAHSLSDALLLINTDIDLKNLLVSALVDRYQFYYVKSNKLTIYSKKMLSLLNQKDFVFYTPSPRNNLLEQSQMHILNGSGLFPYLYKVKDIWGEEGLQKCLLFLYDCFENYEPNEDVILWLKKYSASYQKQGCPFR